MYEIREQTSDFEFRSRQNLSIARPYVEERNTRFFVSYETWNEFKQRSKIRNVHSVTHFGSIFRRRSSPGIAKWLDNSENTRALTEKYITLVLRAPRYLDCKMKFCPIIIARPGIFSSDNIAAGISSIHYRAVHFSREIVRYQEKKDCSTLPRYSVKLNHVQEYRGRCSRE